jgi:hypothetical protein
MSKIKITATEITSEVFNETGGHANPDLFTKAGEHGVQRFFMINRHKGRQRSAHKRVCKKCGAEKVEYKRKNGTRFFACRPCETYKLLKRHYKKFSNEELALKIKTLCEDLERAKLVVNEIMEERKS